MSDCGTSTNKFSVPGWLKRSLGPKKGFFDISGCEIPTDGKVPNMDGVVLKARWFSDEEIAELLPYINAETSLREWIEFRRSRTRNAIRRLALQKNKVVK